MHIRDHKEKLISGLSPPCLYSLCFFGDYSSEGKIFPDKILFASMHPRFKKQRRTRCSPNNIVALQQGNVIDTDNGMYVTKFEPNINM